MLNIISSHCVIHGVHPILCSRYNESGNGKINIQELKTMMEKLKAPQTHLGLLVSVLYQNINGKSHRVEGDD